MGCWQNFVTISFSALRPTRDIGQHYGARIVLWKPLRPKTNDSKNTNFSLAKSSLPDPNFRCMLSTFPLFFLNYFDLKSCGVLIYGIFIIIVAFNEQKMTLNYILSKIELVLTRAVVAFKKTSTIVFLCFSATQVSYRIFKIHRLRSSYYF